MQIFFCICYKLLKLRTEFTSEGDGFLSSVEEETNTGHSVSAADAGLPHNGSVVKALCANVNQLLKNHGCFEIYEQY